MPASPRPSFFSRPSPQLVAAPRFARQKIILLDAKTPGAPRLWKATLATGPAGRRSIQPLLASGVPSYCIPQGMPAISRWLSAATPPVRGRAQRYPDPEGVAACIDVERAPRCDPCQGRPAFSRSVFRRYRCAQPPANHSDPCRGRASENLVGRVKRHNESAIGIPIVPANASPLGFARQDSAATASDRRHRPPLALPSSAAP